MAFLRDVYGLVSSRGKSIVMPKSSMMSYHQDIIVPSLDVRYEMKNGPMRERFEELMSTPGGDVIQIAELLMSIRKNERGELNLVERGRLQNALVLTSDKSVRNVTRTWMQLMDYCGRRGITEIPMMKVKELFADYFDKTTFNNKKFIIDLIYDIQTLSVLKKYVKD